MSKNCDYLLKTSKRFIADRGMQLPDTIVSAVAIAWPIPSLTNRHPCGRGTWWTRDRSNGQPNI